ncbi:MAG: hypothetical protein DMF62_11075 [Acidobacteria bacterium]|nr:MAG: hypothetical protein DMF62_11075 [Acidobacteriota bacterium]PYS99933.1 MAG: hypothetical protein DMF63_09345 [Acidobacteriota bacterium]
MQLEDQIKHWEAKKDRAEARLARLKLKPTDSYARYLTEEIDHSRRRIETLSEILELNQQAEAEIRNR